MVRNEPKLISTISTIRDIRDMYVQRRPRRRLYGDKEALCVHFITFRAFRYPAIAPRIKNSRHDYGVLF